MEFRGVPERARRTKRQIVWIWHLNTHGANLGRDTLGTISVKLIYLGIRPKEHCSSLISMENVYPTAQKSGLVILFLTHLPDQPPKCVVDFSPDWTVLVPSRQV